MHHTNDCICQILNNKKINQNNQIHTRLKNHLKKWLIPSFILPKFYKTIIFISEFAFLNEIKIKYSFFPITNNVTYTYSFKS